MKRAFGIKTAAVLLASLLVCSTPLAQTTRNRNAQHKVSPSESKGRLYTPKVRAYSQSIILAGRISRIEDNLLIIKTARGSLVELEMDANTAMFESGEEISLAAMAHISLSYSDLKVSDRVEVIVERANNRAIARIITRIAGAQVARR